MKKTILIFFIMLFFGCDSKVTKVKFVGKVKKLKSPVIAKVNNIPITVDDYRREKAKLPSNLRKLLKNREKRYQFIQNLIDKELIYEQGKKEHIEDDPDFKEKLQQLKRELIINEFLRKKISEKIIITDKEAKDYYKKNKNDFKEPFEKVKRKIKDILKKEKEQILFQKYLETLRRTAKIEINSKEIENLN